MLTRDDISLAVDHLTTSKATTAETSLSSLTSTHPEQHRTMGNPSRIHQELRSVLAYEEDYDQIQKHSGSNTRNDGMDGATEDSFSYSHDTDGHQGEESETLSNSRSHTGCPIAIIYSRLGEGEERGQTSEGRALLGIPNLDGIPLSFSDDDWYGSSDTEAEYQFEEDTAYSTALHLASGSIISRPSGPRQGAYSPERPIGIILRGGPSTEDMSSEYYVTPTCPEFVGPAEPFPLRSMYNLSHNTTMDNSYISTARETDTITPIEVTGSDSSSPVLLPETNSNSRLHGLGSHDDSSNLEHGRSVFSLFTYSPEESELDIDVIPTTVKGIIPSPGGN